MTECIIWDKCKSETGYGQAWYKGKRIKAHRAAWVKVNGEIPAGMVIDHTCPQHLFFQHLRAG